MTITTTVRGLGDDVSLVLTLYEGSNFFLTSDASYNAQELIAVASLNSEEEQESNPVEFLEPEIFFGTEFEWSMSRQQFHGIRSRKILLRVSFYAIATNSSLNEQGKTPERKLVGNISIDLKEAVPVMTSKQPSNHNISYESHATWKNLMNSKSIVGRQTPAIKYALVLEPNDDSNREGKRSINMSTNTTADSLQDSSKENHKISHSQFYSTDVLENIDAFLPKLMEDKGYFLLGEENKASDTFFFNVYITYGKNLQRAISGPNSGSIRKESKYYFSYDLFGIGVETESFENLADTTKDFLAEKASARIMTNSAALEHYIKNVCSQHPFQIELWVGDNVDGTRRGRDVLAKCLINLSNVLDVSKEKLDQRETIYYEGMVLMNKEDSSNEYGSKAGGRLYNSENFTLEPHIGVRFSISETAGEGLIERLKVNDTITSEIEVESTEALRNDSKIDRPFGLAFNDTLKKVNEEFERSFVKDVINTSTDKTSTSNQKESIMSPKLTVSPVSKDLCSKRPSDDQIASERSKSPRSDAFNLQEESNKSVMKHLSEQDAAKDNLTMEVQQDSNDKEEDIADEDIGSSPPVMTTKVLQENVRKPSTSPHPRQFTSVSQYTQIDKENDNASSDFQHNNSSGVVFDSSTKCTQEENSIITQTKCRFVINLQTITLALGGPINCIITYTSKFSSKEISTKPAFYVQPGKNDNFVTSIQNGYCEFSFSSKLASLEKRLKKYPLLLNVYHENKDAVNTTNLDNNLLLIGKAPLDLSVVFDKRNDTTKCKEIQRKIEVPIFATELNSSSSSSEIGKIHGEITLNILEQLSDTQKDRSSNSIIPSNRSIATTEKELDLAALGIEKWNAKQMELAALDIEKWKVKQKEQFQQQLEKLEQHHINTLSDEWNKRYILGVRN